MSHKSIIHAAALQDLIRQHYQLEGKIQRCPGEINSNYHIQTEQGKQFLLKISAQTSAEIELAQAIAAHLNRQEFNFAVPQTIPTVGGLPYVWVDSLQAYALLQTWVDGRVLAQVQPRTDTLLHQWGACCGQLSRALNTFDHPVAHRFYRWNPSEVLHTRPYAQVLQTATERQIAHHYWDLFERRAMPLLPQLRHSVNHNDAHEHNLIVESTGDARITGIIDFDDVVYTATINELAIACAYAAMDMNDPVAAMQQLVKGYHDEFPIQERELEVLFPLIAARLVLTAVHAAQAMQQQPENEYLQISVQGCWRLLHQLKSLSPDFIHFSFRQVCGYVPCPQRIAFERWMQSNKSQWHPLVDFGASAPLLLDLSVSSLDLGNNTNFLTVNAFDRTVKRLLEDNQTTIGVGGYAEIRPFYTTDSYLVVGNNGPQWRTQHLGLDIWTAAETAVYAPLSGKVHSFQNNAFDCDYGPTIILEHEFEGCPTFYTLYGHLTLDSLEHLSVGMPVKAGQAFCKIGDYPVNGNWSPHLHFQIILHLLDKSGDYPGVAFPSESSTWLSICPPPPDVLVGRAVKWMNRCTDIEVLRQAREQHLPRNLSLIYEQPLHIVRGFQQYLYDQEARRYLDTCNNVAHVGHQHPNIVRAAQRQIGLLNTNTRYLHSNITQYATTLLHTFPDELDVVFFVNSGSEANELALRLAQTYTQQKDMIAIKVGYHGNTGGTVDVSSYKFDGKGGTGTPPHTHVIELPDTYRGRYRDPNTAGWQYASSVEQVIQQLQAQGRHIAGFIGESILSCGGQIVLPSGYLSQVYEHVRKAGGLCIADEVQVGFGRVGEHFWGFELQDVIPDIVTLGKPIGNGHPLAAVVTKRNIADAFANGMEYFNTFGGNPVSCAIGQAVLQTIQDEQLQQNALLVGRYLVQQWQLLQQAFPIIGDVRGKGLFIGVELVSNPDTKVPATTQAHYFANRMRVLGVLTSLDGPDRNVIKIKPPLCFSQADADFFIRQAKQVLQEDAMQV